MAREILGPSRSMPRSKKLDGGIEMDDKCDVMNYRAPYGPSSISNCGPGLGGDNCGNSGSQGKSSTRMYESGSPGLGGRNKGMGTNRRG